MIKPYLHRSLVLPFLSTISLAWGQGVITEAAAPVEDTITPVNLEPLPEPSRNRFGLSYRTGFNVNTSFKGVGQFPVHSNPNYHLDPNGHLVRTYDDGYNGVDINGDNHGPIGPNNSTWFWGYQNGSQHDSVNNTISMHSSSSTGADTSGQDNGPKLGFELTYDRELYRSENWRWGIEAAFNYMPLSISDSRPLKASWHTQTDVYSIPQLEGGYDVPDAPYAGTFEGPGRVIGDTPTTSMANSILPVTGNRKFDADLFGFRLGPYVEIPIAKRVSLSVSGGFAAVYASSEYRFNETAITPTGSLLLAGDSNHEGWLYGGYVSGNISISLSDQWSLFAGVQWEDVGTYTHESHVNGAGSAVLDLSSSLFVSAGVGYSF